MTIEEMRRAVQRKPFRPVTLFMAGGRTIRVPSPEFVLMPPGHQRTYAVHDDNALDVIDLPPVESVRFANGRTRSRRST